MVQQPKSVKYKVIAGYLLLFITAVVSVLFLYREILKIAAPQINNGENNKILKVSNTITRLYESEAVGRNAILTYSNKDVEGYNLLIDSISNDIDTLKQGAAKSQVIKFDSIQALLVRKKNSVSEVIKFRRQYEKKNRFELAIDGIYNKKDAIRKKVKPVQPTRSHEWDAIVNAALSPQQRDSLSKLQVPNDSLAKAFDEVITDVLIKDKKLRYELNIKEQNLLDENRIISDQLRTILSSLEQEFLQSSYAAISKSQKEVADTAKTMAWIGAISLLFFIIFATIIVRDISINQNYRKRLEALNNENEHLLRTKSMLMATVTHDLQTPLGSIIGFQNLLKQSDISPKQSQYLNNIKDATDYIVKLVNDLMDFSRLENNKISVNESAFNIRLTIESVCKALEPVAANKNIELNWDIDDSLDNNFLSDPYRLKQVLTNLVGNALKFTSEGSVEVMAKTETDTIVISIIDTGIGIAHEQQKNVFKEFTQANTGIEKQFGGTGLGLTISKKIITLLGGNIALESEFGKGSVFTITLPKKPVSNTQITRETPIEHSDNAFIANKKILVIDDDAVQLSLMKELLQQFDAHVTTEINAGAAISLMEYEAFDLVLTDIQMPVVDGFELIKRIRQHISNKIAQIPVIALSGRKDIDSTEYNARGFNGYEQKPVALNELLRKIANVLGSDAPHAQEVATQIQENDKKLYNLSSLKFFTGNDDKALKNILQVFVTSAHDNCRDLNKAAKDNDIDKLSDVAHKMIPMLKQMEVNSIVDDLLLLEEKNIKVNDTPLLQYTKAICKKVDILCAELTENYKL